MLGVTSALALVIAPGVASRPAQQGMRVIDRTFQCTTALYRGGRTLRVNVTTGFRHQGRWRWLAAATIENPNERPTRLPARPDGFRPVAFTEWSLGIAAGTGPWTTDPALPKQDPRVAIWSKWADACKPAPRSRVPLTRRGLEGGTADYFGDFYICAAPRRVFARVRAVFDSPTSFRMDHATATVRAPGAVRVASLAVRTASGKPLIFASVDAAGTAKAFTARTCTGP
jgi:hypothetical protein